MQKELFDQRVSVCLYEKNDSQLYECLKDACKYGYIDTVKTIISSNIITVYNIYTLRYACKGGCVEIIELIAKKCRLTNRAKDITYLWLSGLHGACQSGHLDIFKLYLNKLPRIDNFIGYLLSDTCEYGHVDLFNFIISKCQDINIDDVFTAEFNTGFVKACENGHIDIIKLIVDCNFNDIIKLDDGFLKACTEGHIDIVELLIQNGATDFETGFINACEGGHLGIINIMISKGINKWNKGLYTSCKGGHLEIVKFMISNGAECDKNNKYPLYNIWVEGFGNACKGPDNYENGNEINERLEIIKLMIKKGNITYNSVDYAFINSVFENSCLNGHLEIVKFLLSEFMIPKHADILNHIIVNTGLQYACEGGFIEIVEFMISKGATDWNSGLRHACKSECGDNIDIVKLMISKGATDWDDSLRNACCESNIEIIELIILEGKGSVNVNIALDNTHPCHLYGDRSMEIFKLIIQEGITNTQNPIDIANILKNVCKYGNINHLKCVIKYATEYAPHILTTRVLTNTLYRHLNYYYDDPDIAILLINTGADVAYVANSMNFRPIDSTNFRLYCYFYDYSQTSNKYTELLQKYPPYILLVRCRNDKKCCINKLPSELFRLLFTYC